MVENNVWKQFLPDRRISQAWKKFSVVKYFISCCAASAEVLYIFMLQFHKTVLSFTLIDWCCYQGYQDRVHSVATNFRMSVPSTCSQHIWHNPDSLPHVLHLSILLLYPLFLPSSSLLTTSHSVWTRLDSTFLCCSSDKGAVHTFAVKYKSLNKKSRY